jgi:nitroreductase
MTATPRTADHAIDPTFLARWSPRAFSGEALPEADLMSMLEAARWAPSSYNSQPWRFLWARRDTPHWDKFLGLLNEFNRSWAHTASALIFVVSEETMLPPGAAERVPYYSHSFDAGAAWAYLAFQAAKLGWFTHGMAGIEMERIRTELAVPAGLRIECGIAVGKLGDPATLPPFLREREAPSPRKPVSEIAFEGGFPA